MRKKRILFSGEASFLSTGFATFNREILKLLHATGKYELAEVGSYAAPGHPEAAKLPWKFYGVLPLNEHEKKIYDSNRINQFGKYKIDSVLADFQPDIVFDARDPWMFEHLVTSRFRSNYKLVLMPTVDSAPQKREWVEKLFRNADVLTTYSRYGKRILEADGLKVSAVTSPGVELTRYLPLDKVAVRDEFCMTNSLFIYGTVMRNQKRKLLPDLFESYSLLRRKWTNKQAVKRVKEKVRNGKALSRDEKKILRIDHSALYCHTSWPDLGWDIPNYLARFNLHRHVIFTYKCDACNAVFADWFAPTDKQGMRLCRLCGKHAAHMPSTHSGVSQDDLVKIFNLFDVYIQPAICEGWGLPIMESKACGIPGLYQNYSAMEDHVENGGGLPIKIGRFYHEPETASVRSLPKISDLVSNMEKLAFNDKVRSKLAKEARRCAEKMHPWEISSKKLENIFDNLEVANRVTTWDKPPKIQYLTPDRPPAGLQDKDFVFWLYINVLGRAPDQQGFNDWMGNLQKGASRDEVEAFFREQIISGNKFEEIRWKHSMKNRGIQREIAVTTKTSSSVIPGVML